MYEIPFLRLDSLDINVQLTQMLFFLIKFLLQIHNFFLNARQSYNIYIYTFEKNHCSTYVKSVEYSV